MSRMGRVAGRSDLLDELVDHHVVGACDPGLLGGEVHRRRHASQLVQPLLDASGARPARHPLDRQVDFHDLHHTYGGYQCHDRISSILTR